MDAIQLLKQEHEKAKQMFQQIRSASAAERGPLWVTLRPELKAHEQMEETALYSPVAEQAGSNDQTLRDWLEHHHREVTELEGLIQQISGLDATSDQWMQKVSTLQQTLEHHIQEEEGKIWPRIQEVWDRGKLDQAGQQMERMKRQLVSQAA
jgi:hemerythrin-like domain-containing protein